MHARAERIAISGVGLVSALGNGARASFDRLCSGESGIRALDLFDASALPSKIAAQVAELPPACAGVDRTDRMALAAAREALAAAHVEPGRARIGLSLGGTTAGMFETEEELRLPASTSDFDRRRRLLTHPLSSVERVLERELGPFARSVSVCSACSSGAVALVLAAHWIQSAAADLVLAGGADGLCRMTYAGFSSLGLVDKEACRPFDAQRKGLTLGEGAGFLVLETESSAARRGVPVLAWLSGWALGAEAHHATQPEASGVRAARLMREALQVAGLEPSQIDYVNAHGTGTPANDSMEALALRSTWGDALSALRVSSSKGQLGHTLGAAGAIEAAICALSLTSGRVPPNLGLEVAEATDIRFVRGAAEAIEPRAVLSNSFGFGGMDAVLVLEAASSERRGRERGETSVVVSALAAVGKKLWVDGAASRALESRERVAPELEDPLSQLEANRSRRFDRATALAALAAQAALASAGLAPAEVGVVLGSAYGPVERSLHFLERILERGLRAAAPAEFPQLVPSAAAGSVSIYLGARGPLFSVAAGALSAESAFAQALGVIELGVGGAMLAGAIDARDTVVAALAAELLPTPSVARSEGGGILLLERESSARARGKTPLARLSAHLELRTLAKGFGATLRAPRDPASARVVLAVATEELSELLAESPWAHVTRVVTAEATGFFEAVGATALAVGVALVNGGASEVLVFGSDAGVVHLNRFERIEPT